MEETAGRRVIRPYQPGDREVVRAICGDTGFLSKPIDPAFEDRELFADYLTKYYTDAEPESTYVCEIDGVVKGYIMGSRFPKKKAAFERWHIPVMVLRGLWRYFARPYSPTTRSYVKWIITRARKEQPFTPPNMPHFHFNMRPEARTVAGSREITDIFLQYLRDCGETHVYCQVVTYETRRGVRMFERYGFEVVDEREVTKYREIDPRRIFLFTIVKDLTANAALYGLDLRKEEAPDSPTEPQDLQ